MPSPCPAWPVGSRVILIIASGSHADRVPAGVEGVYIGRSSYDIEHEIFVDFSEWIQAVHYPEDGYFHTCDGQLPHNTGRSVRASCLALSVNNSPPELAADKVQSSMNFLVINGLTYEARLTRREDLEAHYKREALKVVDTFAPVRQSYEDKIKGLTSLMQLAGQVPIVTVHEALANCRAFVRDSEEGTGLLVPFQYEPKFITQGNITKHICPEHQAALKRTDLFMQFKANKSGLFQGDIQFRNPDGSRFVHFHSVESSECFGSFAMPTNNPLTPALALKVAKEYSRLLETINGSSLGGFVNIQQVSYRDIWEKGIPITEEEQKQAWIMPPRWSGRVGALYIAKGRAPCGAWVDSMVFKYEGSGINPYSYLFSCNTDLNPQDYEATRYIGSYRFNFIYLDPELNQLLPAPPERLQSSRRQPDDPEYISSTSTTHNITTNGEVSVLESTSPSSVITS